MQRSAADNEQTLHLYQPQNPEEYINFLFMLVLDNQNVKYNSVPVVDKSIISRRWLYSYDL